MAAAAVAAPAVAAAEVGPNLQVQQAPTGIEQAPTEAAAEAVAAAEAAADTATFDFELQTPMLVMPYAAFKAQGRIFRSVKAWREEALRDGRLVVHAEAGRDHRGKIVVFISHTWWDRLLGKKKPPKIIIFISHRWWRPHADPAQAHPDQPDGLKHKTIVRGIEQLIGDTEHAVAHRLLGLGYFAHDSPNPERKTPSMRAQLAGWGGARHSDWGRA